MTAAEFCPVGAYPGARTPWPSTCLRCGDLVTPTVSFIKAGGRGCKRCGNVQSAVTRRRDTEGAVAIMEANGFYPLEPYAGNKVPWRCRCQGCKKEVELLYNSVQQGHGCPWCSGRRIDALDAVQVMRRAGFEPLVTFPGAKKPWLALCTKCDCKVSPTYSTIKRGGGCAGCAGQVVDPMERACVMRDAGLEPLDAYPGAHNKWKCRCNCGHIVWPQFANIAAGWGGCGWCVGNVLDDAELVRRQQVMKAAGLNALVPWPGANRPWPCRCDYCDRETSPTYRAVAVGGACKWCASRGIQLGQPGYVYLVTHQMLNAHKIGIRNADTDRLVAHKIRGWKLYRERRFQITADARSIEQDVKKWWRYDLHLPPCLGPEDMPQAGYTETVSADALSLPDIWAKVLELSAALRAEPEPVVPLGQLAFPFVEDQAAA